jgi:hypothetical protein
MSPEGSFHKFWDLYVIFLLLYTAFFTPYKLAFIEIDSFPVYVMELIVDLSFWFDIIVNFLTAIEDSRGTLIKDYKRIASIYLTGWFFLDFTACIPIDQIMTLISAESSGSEVKLARLARLYRLWRLVRIMRMSKIIKMAKSGGF